MGARAANMVLGAWLVLSAFLWAHSSAQFTNAWICGVLVVGLALLASGPLPSARYGNAVVGGWLILSAFVLPRVNVGTLWNHVLVGIGVLVLGLVGPGSEMHRTRAAAGTAH
jgi:hypothetical protein